MEDLSSWLAQNLDTLAVLITRRETAVGAAVGLLVLWALAWTLTTSRRRGRAVATGADAGLYGAAWITAGAAALGLARGLPAAVVIAVVAAAATRGRFGSVRRSVVLGGAGILVALTLPGGGAATQVAVAGALPIAVVGSAWWARHGGGQLLPFLLVVTLAGQVAVLPDVEEVLGLAAAGGVLVLAGLPPLRARFGEMGAAGAAALLVWTAGIGGYGRPSAVVGGLAAFGVIVAVPVGLAVARRRTVPASVGAATALLVAHLAGVLIVTRNAGLRDGAGEGWLVAGATFAFLGAAAAVVAAFNVAVGSRDPTDVVS